MNKLVVITSYIMWQSDTRMMIVEGEDAMADPSKRQG
jgi:hypothetical protein